MTRLALALVLLAVAGCATVPPVRDGCDRDVPVRCHPPTAEAGGKG